MQVIMIELINSMTNSNLKIRSLAQKIFSDICEIMRRRFNAVNQLFTIILVGLAANKPHTQSSTIRSLIFAIKQNVILNVTELVTRRAYCKDF